MIRRYPRSLHPIEETDKYTELADLTQNTTGRNNRPRQS